MIFVVVYDPNPYKKLHFIYKKEIEKMFFRMVLENTCIDFPLCVFFFGIYIEFEKLFNDLTNI